MRECEREVCCCCCALFRSAGEDGRHSRVGPPHQTDPLHSTRSSLCGRVQPGLQLQWETGGVGWT